MRFFKSIPIYIRLYKNRAKVSRLDNGTTIEKTASTAFSNERIILGDYLVAEEFLKGIIQELIPKKTFSTRFTFILHPLELTEGGLTEVEKRAMRDSAIHVGANEVYISESPIELTPQEVLDNMEK